MLLSKVAIPACQYYASIQPLISTNDTEEYIMSGIVPRLLMLGMLARHRSTSHV